MSDNNKKPLEYEARVLNALTEPTYKRHAFKKLGKYQESKGWVFNQETQDYNPVNETEEIERDLFLDLSGRLIAILASDKNGAIGSIESLLSLVESDPDKFTAYYNAAIEVNPTLAEKEPDKNDPN
jgi:hypothetical protein